MTSSSTSSSLPPHSRSRIVPLLLVLALFGAACSRTVEPLPPVAAETTDPPPAEPEPTTSSPPTTESEPTTTVPPVLANAEAIDFAALDTIDWSECGVLLCATVDVPIDYEDPEAGTIAIAVNKRTADSPDDRIGYLLANPGGPGDAGLSLVEQAGGTWSDPILDRFDIIGFDPRGIGESEPTLSCGTLEEQQAIVDTYYAEPGTPEHIEFGERYLELCFEESGPALSRVHAQYVARDMDEIRKRLGVEQITFHGLSWGAHIGVWYATLFPEHTRAMVIDAALDPTQVGHTRIEMAKAFEVMLQRAIEACDATCPIYNDGYPVGYYLDAMEKFGLVAEAVGDESDLWSALIGPVYSAGLYPALWNAVYELGENDNPEPFVELASPLEGGPDAEPTDEELALIDKNRRTQASANCVDELVLHPQVTRDYLLTEEVDIEQPLLEAAGRAVQQAQQDAAEEDGDGDEETEASLDFCAFLQPYAPAPFTGDFDGGDVPILVVANAFEGPIPYGQSKTLATEVLSNGYLIDVLGSRGHVVYPSNRCVVDLVDAQLVELELPAERISTCEAEDLGEGENLEAFRIQRHGQCVGRILPDFVELDQAELRAAIVCSDLLTQAMEQEGSDGLDNTELLDRLLYTATEMARSLTAANLAEAQSFLDGLERICLGVIADDIVPQVGAIPDEKAASMCETVVERAIAAGVHDAADQDDVLSRIFEDVVGAEYNLD